ncbi:URC4/urg3 family protein [Caenimonas terrae]|uniref:URC4/urg3 family protein n=1 Tax=Caenimonas terrae TaxID=696074 RepID=A0ABW0NIG5_9BURK
MSDAVTHAQAEHAADILRTTAAVRERCGQLLARARRGESRWWTVDDGKLADAAHAVTAATKERYPRLHIPFHSRWRHFEAGGMDRKAQLDRLLEGMDPASRAESMIDLTVVSVLLDAGAGSDWKYVEPATGKTFTRSEGLAVASFHAFTGGLFSSDKSHPLQADSAGLRALVTDHLASAFQVGPANPMVGLEGRAVLLRRLGEAMSEQPEVFGEDGRPGGLFDMLVTPHGSQVPHTADITAHDILSQLLMSLSGIWPAGNNIGGVPLGDCWRHSAVRGEGASDGWVPFHKLSQWLTYSLLEPFAWAGVQVRGLEALTGLPEYRNGGLLVDSGVLVPREASARALVWQPGDELIVEWRALTVALLDELAVRVRQDLGQDEHHLPLARVLEGGTWAAGRASAQRLRGGLPPLTVASDGTVF